MKKTISAVLIILMLLSSVPFCAFADYTEGDETVFFGSYPQTLVTDNDEKQSVISSLSPSSFTALYRYCGMGGTSIAEKTKVGEYCDVEVEGEKYRALRFSSTVPAITNDAPYPPFSYQDENGVELNSLYIFRYESIEWQILDKNEKLLISKNILEPMALNNVTYKSGNTYYTDSVYTIKANDYSSSTLRSDLNIEFLSLAFSSFEQKRLVEFTNGDTVSILSEDECLNSIYGFATEKTAFDDRKATQGTDYAKYFGLYVDENGLSPWRTSSVAQDGTNAAIVSSNGTLTYSYSTTKCSAADSSIGVRPVIKLTSFNILTTFETGDIVEFGFYPQSRVTDSYTLNALKMAVTSWKDYGVYSGSGAYGSARKTNAIKYTDIIYGGKRYRGIKFTAYTPKSTHLAPSEDSCQYENGYYTNETYFFLYEPVEWRVLDPDTGLVMSEMVLDQSTYCNFVNYSQSSGNYVGVTKADANNWETSALRSFLNDSFLNTAFSDGLSDDITTSENQNSYSGQIYYSITSGEKQSSTFDKVFALSLEDITKANGFTYSADPAQNLNTAIATDYALCMGVKKEMLYNGASYSSPWLLRTPSSFTTLNVSVVDAFGYNTMENDREGDFIDTAAAADDTFYGVRPAIYLDLVSDNVKKTGERAKGMQGAVRGITASENIGYYLPQGSLDNMGSLNAKLLNESEVKGFGYSYDNGCLKGVKIYSGNGNNLLPGNTLTLSIPFTLSEGLDFGRVYIEQRNDTGELIANYSYGSFDYDGSAITLDTQSTGAFFICYSYSNLLRILNNTGSVTVRYREKLQFTVSISSIGANEKIAVYIGNSDNPEFIGTYGVSTCTFTTDEIKKSKKLTVAVIDENGNEVRTEKLNCNLNIEVKTNIFARIAAFFRFNLFKKSQTVTL